MLGGEGATIFLLATHQQLRLAGWKMTAEMLNEPVRTGRGRQLVATRDDAHMKSNSTCWFRPEACDCRERTALKAFQVVSYPFHKGSRG